MAKLCSASVRNVSPSCRCLLRLLRQIRDAWHSTFPDPTVLRLFHLSQPQYANTPEYRTLLNLFCCAPSRLHSPKEDLIPPRQRLPIIRPPLFYSPQFSQRQAHKDVVGWYGICPEEAHTRNSRGDAKTMPVGFKKNVNRATTQVMMKTGKPVRTAWEHGQQRKRDTDPRLGIPQDMSRRPTTATTK